MDSQHYVLPTGTLNLTIQQAELPPDALFGIGARQNPKRAFLFVSKVLGKHYPVSVQEMRQVHARLAAKLPVFQRPPVFIGMAETATALAQGVFEAWLRAHPAAQALYLQTSRLRAQGAAVCHFEESHSHASRQWLHLPTHPQHQHLLQQADSVVLIDDELSTGNTFRQLVAALRPFMPALQHIHWVCLTDFSSEASNEADKEIQRHSLLRGAWIFEGNGQQVAAAPAAQAEAGAEVVVTDSGFGRVGISHAVQLPDRLLANSVAPIQAGDKVLVLGTGEFIHPPAVFAYELAQRSGAHVYVQSSTRSPALVWNILQHKRSFADPYDEGVPYYLYNLPPQHTYQHIFICHEHPANSALRATAAELNAQLIHQLSLAD